MATRDALNYPHADRTWLEPYMPPVVAGADGSTKPFVTLTFATSLDSALSISPGVQTALSGQQSKAMTHYLRSRHDAILVGVGTAIADNPSLNCRMQGTGGYGGEGLTGQPRPLVIDPHARWAFSEQSKVMQLAMTGHGKAPWIVTLAAPPAARKETLEKAGGEYMIIKGCDSGSAFAWKTIFAELARRGIRSVMVEGGANVINSLLSPTESDLVDSVIVTIAPVWLGPDALKVLPARTLESERGKLPVARLNNTKWHQLGDDAVLCGQLR